MKRRREGKPERAHSSSSRSPRGGCCCCCCGNEYNQKNWVFSRKVARSYNALYGTRDRWWRIRYVYRPTVNRAGGIERARARSGAFEFEFLKSISGESEGNAARSRRSHLTDDQIAVFSSYSSIRLGPRSSLIPGDRHCLTSVGIYSSHFFHFL